MTLQKFEKMPLCRWRNDENPATNFCWKCKITLCAEHTTRCVHCHGVGDIPWYCPSCAAEHEVLKWYRGGCVDKYTTLYSNLDKFGDREVIDANQEKYRKMGL